MLSQVHEYEPLYSGAHAQHEVLGVPSALLARPYGQAYSLPGEWSEGPRRPFGPVPRMRNDGEELIAWYMQQGLSYGAARASIYSGDWDVPCDAEVQFPWDPTTYEALSWWKSQDRRRF